MLNALRKAKTIFDPFSAVVDKAFGVDAMLLASPALTEAPRLVVPHSAVANMESVRDASREMTSSDTNWSVPIKHSERLPGGWVP